MKRFLGLLCFACVVASSSPGFAQSTPSLGFSPAPASSWTANRSLALPHPLPAPSLPAVPPGASAPAPSRAPAIALASLGLLGLGVGSTLGYLALDEKAKAEDHCSDAQRLCDSTGDAANRKGRTYSTLSLAALAFGGAMVGASIWLFATRSPRARVAAQLSPSMARLRFEAAF